MSAIVSARTVLLLAGAVMLGVTASRVQGQSQPSGIMVLSTVTTDRPGERGRREVDAMAGALESVFAEALQVSFPCARVNASSDTVGLAWLQRWKDLLGISDEIPDFTGIQGVDYVLVLQVEHAGDQIRVTAKMLDSGTARAVQESSVSGPASDFERFEAFAASFARGTIGPRCGRSGTVLVQTKIDDRGRTPGGASYGSSESKVLSCSFALDAGLSGDGYCNYTSVSQLTGSGYTQDRRATATGASAHAGFTFADGRLRFSISGFTARFTISGSLGTVDDEVMVGPFPFEIPTNSTSGSWSDGAGTTVSWSLPGK